MSIRTICECNICNKEIKDGDKEGSFRLCVSEHGELHAHIKCLNDRVARNRSQTCNMTKLNLVIDFLFGKGWKE